MMKFSIGSRVRIGGSKGCIMTIQEIHGDDLLLVDEHSRFYFHKGDCVLLPVKDTYFEQLHLFDV